jgi:hypothetical protein
MPVAKKSTARQRVLKWLAIGLFSLLILLPDRADVCTG